MFFCEACKAKNNWPGWCKASHGRCEMCGTVADCYDVPSSALPLSRRKEEERKPVTKDDKEVKIDRNEAIMLASSYLSLGRKRILKHEERIKELMDYGCGPKEETISDKDNLDRR
jgi:hypothetical protein